MEKWVLYIIAAFAMLELNLVQANNCTVLCSNARSCDFGNCSSDNSEFLKFLRSL